MKFTQDEIKILKRMIQIELSYLEEQREDSVVNEDYKKSLGESIEKLRELELKIAIIEQEQ